MKYRSYYLILCLFSSISVYSQQQDEHTRTELLLLNRQFNQAINEAGKVLASDSLNSRANFNMGQAYIGLLKYPEALKVFTRADQLDPDNITILNAIGETWSALGALNKAIDTYYKIIRLDSTNYYGYIQLGKLYQRQNEFLRAIPIYQYLCKTDTGNFYYYKQLGICFQKINDPETAAHYLELALSLNPMDVGLYPQLANIYIQTGNFQYAINLLALGLQQDSTNSQIIKVKAYAHLLAHQSKPAIEGFQKLLDRGDSSLFVNKYIGLAYYENEDYVEAVSHLESAYFADTTIAENCYYYALALSADYAKRKSIIYFKKSVELQQPNASFIASIYKKIGENYRHVSQFQNSLNYYLLAREEDPYDREVLFTIASIYDFNIKNQKKALEYYEKFMEGAEEIKHTGEDSNVISISAAAAKRIELIREELHFKGELEK